MARSTAARSVPAARRFAIESLENRELMAGDITFNVIGGNLFINGDNAANGLQIGQVAPNQFALIGTEQGGGNTSVQGARFQIASGVTGSVFINMNGGNDAIKIEDGPVPLISPVAQAGVPRSFQFPVFAQNMVVNMGAGADNFVSEGMELIGRLAIDTGFGNEVDTIKMERLEVNANNTGGLALDIDTQGGNDKVEVIDGVMRGLVDIDTGSEDDIVNIEDILIGRNSEVRIRTQAGNDNVTVRESYFTDLDIDTGAGQDFVNLDDIFLEALLSVNLGADSDILQTERLRANSVELDGSFGTDALIDQGDNAVQSLIIRNFEIVVD